MKTYTVEQSKFAHFLTADTKSAPLWFIVRLYLGYEWVMAGWDKVINPAWFGSGAGAALQGFVKGAVAKTVCAPGVPAAACHPDVQMWYASFLQSTVLPHVMLWSNFVAVGEILVGVGLIVGLFTGIAAFFGFFMNLNFMFAGTVSINPILLVLALPLMIAYRVAGYWGLDRYARPYLSRRFRSHKHP
jgi:thiosulfate dehydrogenase (quinone) large subunit